MLVRAGEDLILGGNSCNDREVVCEELGPAEVHVFCELFGCVARLDLDST